MILVVDASVTIAWMVTDEESAYAEAALSATGSDPALVPVIWRWEMANVLLALERRGRIADATAAYENVVRRLPMRSDGRTAEVQALDALEVARTYGLSAYDASYLSLARANNVPLATLDRELAKAASALGLFFEKRTES